jgi:hypothetical protein
MLRTEEEVWGPCPAVRIGQFAERSVCFPEAVGTIPGVHTGECHWKFSLAKSVPLLIEKFVFWDYFYNSLSGIEQKTCINQNLFVRTPHSQALPLTQWLADPGTQKSVLLISLAVDPHLYLSLFVLCAAPF